MKKLFLAFFTIALLFFLLVIGLVEGQGGTADYEAGLERLRRLKEEVGLAQDDEISKRVQTIFERICRAADLDPSAYKVFVSNSPAVNAMSLPGGFVVLDKGLYNLCDSDHELAFILAHELAHISANHHDKMESALAGFAAEFSMDSRFPTEISRQKEMEADQKGVIFSAVAGYDAGASFNILDKAITRLDNRHPSKEERKKRIKERVQAVTDKVDLFHAGILFFYIGDLDASEGAFRNFLSVYESSEVYNNLGGVYHQRTKSGIFDPCRPNPPAFKSAPLLDVMTGAESLSVPVSTANACDRRSYMDWLQRASAQYLKAISMNPGSANASLNLGTAYDDAGEHEMAVSLFKKVIKTGQNLKEAHNNLGAAYIRLNEYGKALESFKRALSYDPDFPNAYFNLGILKDIEGQKAQGEKFFQQFLERVKGQPKGPYLQYALKTLGKKAAGEIVEAIETDALECSNPLEGIKRHSSMMETRKKLGTSDVTWSISVEPEIIMDNYREKGLWVVYREKEVFHVAMEKALCKTSKGWTVGREFAPLLKNAETIGTLPTKLYIRDGTRLFVGDRTSGMISRWMAY